jgi:hypothetical protein
MTVKEVQENPVQIGDFVKVVHGGSKRSRDLIWQVTEVMSHAIPKFTAVKIKLMNGYFVDMDGKTYGVGYERGIRMICVKKIDASPREICK